MKCTIVRNKANLYPQYELYLEKSSATANDQLLMCARKRKKSKASNYAIYTGRMHMKQKENVVGKLRFVTL